ncbi:MAG: hypothetical protein ABI131_12415, partial [Nostocoides sp.]
VARRKVETAAATPRIPTSHAAAVDHEVAQEQPYGFEEPARATATDVGAATLRAGGPVDEDDLPLTWEPRPVPRPTYTMKARVDRALPPPADVTPTPIGIDEDDDVRPVQPQRHTG